jgi:[ribosomal protein S5]-alanine N-acetyltransferase
VPNAYLEGENVYLRALERADLSGNMFRWANDPEVTKYMMMGVVPNTIEALEAEYDALRERGTAGLMQFANPPENVVFAVCDRGTDKHIGNVGIFGINWIVRTGEFRAIIGEKDFWGGGYGFEAYRLCIGWAFDRLNLRRLAAGTHADHVGSMIALKKVGFVQEGVLRELLLRDEKPADVVAFGLLRDEFYALFPADSA